jgi:hypothetical protein
MKAYKLFTAFLLIGILSSFSLSAQDEREDVVYLKNGSIYRGIIIEQVPGVSLKIETAGGNVFSVAIGDVAKFTKEKKAVSDTQMHHDHDRGDMHGEGYYRGDMHGERYYSNYRYGRSDSSHRRPQFQYRNKGYFNTAQLLINNLEGGGRLVNGYKFGHCGYLGVGIGVDLLFNDVRRNNSDYSGVYLPLYLYYGGDILKKRITPFYSIEAGYAMRVNPNNNNNNFPNQNFLTNNSGATSMHGGLMGGVGFGVKFYSRHRVFFSLSAHADFQQASNTYTNYYDANGNFYPTYKTNAILLIPGIRLGLGF